MFNSISWEEDYLSRMNPAMLTSLLQEAVPVLQYTNWQVLETAPGFTRAVLPLNHNSTNQHGTHQAALIALAADYTGGIALATLLAGVPVIGVHPQTGDNGAALWLVSINIQYKTPSTGDLILSASISPDKAAQLREQYFSGQTVIENLKIEFSSQGEQVATATLGYFVRQSRCLKPKTPDGKLSTLFGHRVKASARLIAGMRATENSQPWPLYSDPYSEIAAGAHGRLLTEKFMEILPQMREMVAARTRNIDDLILSYAEQGISQVVLIGAGFDFRPYRLFRDGEKLTVFELDLPYMLEERHKILAELKGLPSLEHREVGINLELQDTAETLMANGFDPQAGTLVIFEGASMYFDCQANARILGDLARLLQNPLSRIWIDVVAKRVIDRTSGIAAVEDFLAGMEKLGEPFIFGLDEPVTFFKRVGLEIESRVPSNYYRSELTNPVFELYNFYTLKPGGSNCYRGTGPEAVLAAGLSESEAISEMGLW